MVGQMKINKCRVSELNNENINVTNFLSKFVEKLLKNRITFNDIFTFSGIDYRDAPLITLYFVVLEISVPKIRPIK